MNDYYVYAYIRLDTNTYFYIGKGRGIRYKRINDRKKHFKNILNKCQCVVELLYTNLSEQEAFYLETKTIEELVFEEGYTLEIDNDKNEVYHLVNMTFGGEGISGYRYTKEQCKNCSRKGSQNGMYGKRGKDSPHYGKTYSKEHKDKIRESNPRSSRVRCIELDIYANSYREMSKLLEDYNIICSHASISAQVRNKINYCGKYKNGEIAYLHFEKITLND